MPTAALTTPDPLPVATSLSTKLLNIFVSPGDVFDEVVATPPNSANWRVPTLLVILTGIILLRVTTPEAHSVTAFQQALEPGTVSAAQTEAVAGGWPLVASLAVCVSAVAGTFWSAFVLWLIGRLFLKTRFPFLKAVEVVGLTGIILVLGAIVTALLIAASGDVAARPALSLIAGKWDASLSIRPVLDVLNLFHIWSTLVLAVGLSKLSGVSFKEAAFWVLGYWGFVRLALIVLA
jgi:hypothetical protein